MIDVMFYEVFKEEETAIKNILPKKIKAKFTRNTIQEHNNKTLPADLISVRTQSHIPKSWSRNLKGILTRSQGYDHLLSFRRQIKEDIPCGYLGSYCARAAAEQAIMTMFALLRKLKKQVGNFDTFARDGLTGLQCRGRNALIVGVGNIGGEIVDIVGGLRMNVKGSDIDQKNKKLNYVTLSDGIRWADIVFCALPLNKETNGLLDYKLFSQAMPGVILINIARGEISPVSDLKRLLDENILGGLALDVYPNESALAHCFRAGVSGNSSEVRIIQDLAKKEQVLFTPHNAFNTEEALQQKAKLSAEAVDHYLQKGAFPLPIPSI